MKSILQSEKECYKTHSTLDLDKHHIMNGPYRNKAEKYGLWVYLRHDIHMWLHSTSDGQKYARTLKKEAQIAFEKKWSHALWMDFFGRNYL